MSETRYKTTRSNRDLGRLYTILNDAFPKLRNKDGALDVRRLAEIVKVSHTYLYNSFKKEEINSDTAKAIAAASKDKLSFDDLAIFINYI